MLPEPIFIVDLLTIFGIYLIITLSLNIEFGYAGIPNFGKMLSIIIGAFVIAYFPGRLLCWLLGIGKGLDYVAYNVPIMDQLNYALRTDPALGLSVFTLTLILAVIAGALVGLLVSTLFVRLRAEYLAIVLLMLAEVPRLIGAHYPPIAGGTLGIGIPNFFGWTGAARFTFVMLLTMAIALIVLLYVELLMRSPLGRVLRGLRDSEDAAASLGKDIGSFRAKAFTVASAIAAIAGVLYATHSGSVVSVGYTRGLWTFWPWAMAILGGVANNIGVVLGTFAFVALRKLIVFYKWVLEPYLPFSVVWIDPIMLGVVIVLILMFKPEGIIPEKPTPTIDFSKIKVVRLAKGGK